MPSSAAAQHAQNVLDKAFPQANGTGSSSPTPPRPLERGPEGAVQAGAQYLSTGNVGLVGRPVVQFSPDRKGGHDRRRAEGNPGQTSYRNNIAAIQDV